MAEPWDEDKRPSGTGGMVAFGCTAMLLGIGVLVNGFLSTFPNAAGLSKLAELWSAGGGSGSAFAAQFFIVCNYLGGAVLLFGILGLVSHKIQSRPLAALSLVATLLIGGAQIAGAVMYMGLNANAFSFLVKNPYQTAFNSEQAALSDTASALYNKCCFNNILNSTVLTQSRKDSIQREVFACPEETGIPEAQLVPKVCAALDERVRSLLDIFGATSVLCTCYYQSSYNKISPKVTDDVCSAITENVVVKFDDSITLPDSTITVSTILKQTEKVAKCDANQEYTTGLKCFDRRDDFVKYLPIKTIRLTGELAPRTPWKIESVAPDQGSEAWGCGFGYAKAVAFGQQLFIQQTGSTTSFILIFAGSVEILASVLVFIFWNMSGGSSEEWVEYGTNSAVQPGKDAQV